MDRYDCLDPAVTLHPDKLDLATAIARVTIGPARILGLPLGRLDEGRTADVCVFASNQHPLTDRRAKDADPSAAIDPANPESGPIGPLGYLHPEPPAIQLRTARST